MFQNMLMTSLTPLSDMKEPGRWENHAFRTVWPEPCHQRPKENSFKSIKRTITKKKRNRTAYTTAQLNVLEEVFQNVKYITRDFRINLSQRLKIDEKCIKIWFQNKRMKLKHESNECDSSSSNEPISPSSYNTENYHIPQFIDNNQKNYQTFQFNNIIHTHTPLNSENETNKDNQCETIADTILEELLSIAKEGHHQLTNRDFQISAGGNHSTKISNDFHTDVNIGTTQLSNDIHTSHENENNNVVEDEASYNTSTIIFDALQTIATEEQSEISLDQNNAYASQPESISEYNIPSDQYNAMSINYDFIYDNTVYPTYYYPNVMEYYTNCVGSQVVNFDNPYYENISSDDN